MASGSFFAQGLVVSLLLAGCAQQPGMVPLVRVAQFNLGPNTVPAATMGTTMTRTPASVSPVRLLGEALVPETLTDAGNLDNGKVSGAQVLVLDAIDGQTLAQTVTYYDGSFAVNVPLGVGARSVLVTSTLVAKDQPNDQVTLMAPALLRAGAGDQQVVLTPGSTALVALLSGLADLQTGQTDTPPTLAPLAPGAASTKLGGLIAVMDGNTSTEVSALAEAAPELQGSHSLAELKYGIQQYVSRLIKSQVTTK